MASSSQRDVLIERTTRIKKLNAALGRLFPIADIALTFKDPWELLVAVILSAQCTDKKVNEVTATLFKKYRTLDDYVRAVPAEFQEDIKPTGFYKNKTKSILESAALIKERYGGKVPDTMEELLTLRGVARKTANIVLQVAYGKSVGIPVDTHVWRFAVRYDLTDHPRDPKKIEYDLMAILPQEEWRTFTYRVIEYGRQIAPARKYDTTKDPLVKIYPPAATRFRNGK